MARRGIFDPGLSPGGLFDDEQRAGLFDGEFLLDASSTPTVEDTPTEMVAGTQSLRRGAVRRWGTAVAASAMLWSSTPQDASAALGPQPETQQTPIAGNKLRSARYKLQPSLGWTSDGEVAQVAQPDTVTPPIAGARLRSSRFKLQPQLGWSTTEVQVVAEPETYQPPIAGQRFSTGAFRRQPNLGWHSGTDVSGPLDVQPDTYQPPIEGLGSIRTTARRFSLRQAIASALLWRTAVDESGPLATQPDTDQQPVQGTQSLKRANKLRGLHGQSWIQDTPDTTPVQPDTVASPIAGTDPLSRAARAFTRRAGLASLGWSSGTDQSGPLGVQPDTYQPPIEGLGALKRNSKLRPQPWLLHAPDIVNTTPPEPDTYTQPVQGTTSLGLRRLAWTRRAIQAALGWHSPTDVSGPLATQPDTYQPPVEGPVAFKRNTKLRPQHSLLWTPSAPAPVVVTPDTAPQPVQGTASLGRAAAQWARRVVRAALGWHGGADPVSTFPDLGHTTRIVGSDAFATGASGGDWKDTPVAGGDWTDTPVAGGSDRAAAAGGDWKDTPAAGGDWKQALDSGVDDVR